VKMIRKIITLALTGMIAMAVCATAYAAKPTIIPEGTKEALQIPKSPSGTEESLYFRGGYLPEMTKIVIQGAGVAAVLFIIIGGIQILTAYGNDEAIGKAKKTIEYAIIGLLIAILSYAIVSIISVISLQ
jgi:hypothetical protein